VFYLKQTGRFETSERTVVIVHAILQRMQGETTMKTTFAGLVISVVLLQAGCALFPTPSHVHKLPEAMDAPGSKTRNSAERSTTSSSPGMDRLTEIEQFLQAPGSGSSANRKPQQTPPLPAATLSMEQLREIEQHFQGQHDSTSMIRELKPGQHVCLLTHSVVSRTPDSARHSIEQIAGTIVSVDDNVLILNNAVKLIEGRVETGAPILNKVPYPSRLFKNSGVSRQAIAIPGEISIARTDLQKIDELTSEDLAALHQNSDSARIGVNFESSLNIH